MTRAACARPRRWHPTPSSDSAGDIGAAAGGGRRRDPRRCGCPPSRSGAGSRPRESPRDRRSRRCRTHDRATVAWASRRQHPRRSRGARSRAAASAATHRRRRSSVAAWRATPCAATAQRAARRAPRAALLGRRVFPDDGPCVPRGSPEPVRGSRHLRVRVVRRLRMPSYLSPGVYVQEVSSGSKPIEGVGTAVAAFVGLTEKGPANTPTLVTNWTQFSTVFGDFVEGSYLAHAVYGYFLNGGGSAYVVRIGSDGDAAQPSAGAELAARGEPGRNVYRVTAAEGGPAGDDISVEISDPGEPGEDTFKVSVSKGGKVEETFDNVTTKRGPTNAATVVKARSKLIRLEEIGSGGTMIVPE